MENNRKRSFRKKMAAAVSALLIVALLLAGTFAWYVSSKAVNEFKDSGQEAALLHDDFDPDRPYVNKDVYVENIGKEEPIFVRIRLQEYMDITSSQCPEDIEDLWETHYYGDCTLADKEGKKYHTCFDWVMGGEKAYKAGQEFYQESNVLYDFARDNDTYDSGDPGTKDTLDGNIISLSDYKDLLEEEKEGYIGWIYDEDGWAYWSQLLAAGEATGLLLDQVSLVDPTLKNTAYYYAINVIMEAVNEDDIAMWTKGEKSIDGKDETEKATDDMAEILEGMLSKVDTSDLEAAIAEAEALDTTGAIQNLKDALDTAVADGKGLLAAPKKTQKAVDDAAEAIRAAIRALKDAEKPDKSLLEEWIQKGEELDTSEVEDAGLIKDLEDAITNGKAVMEDDDATQEEVDDAVEAIQDAIEAIEKAIEDGKNKVTITGISAAIGTAKTDYQEDDTFNPDGIIITVRKSDGSSETITNDFTAKGVTFAPDPLTKGLTEITVTYEGKTATLDIPAVQEKTPDPLEVEINEFIIDVEEDVETFASACVAMDALGESIKFDTDSFGVEAMCYGYIPLSYFLKDTSGVTIHSISGLPSGTGTITTGTGMNLNRFNGKDYSTEQCIIIKWLPTTFTGMAEGQSGTCYTDATIQLKQGGKISGNITIRMSFAGFRPIG